MQDNSLYATEDLLLSSFIPHFEESFPDITYSFHDNDSKYIEIQAVNSSIGSLSIYFDDSEITICLGEFWHAHCEPYTESEEGTFEEAIANAIERAISIVDGILNDQYVLILEYRGSRLASSTVAPVENPDAGIAGVIYVQTSSSRGLLNRLFNRERVEYHIWSGPYEKNAP